MPAVPQHRAPAARARIPAARAVGVDLHDARGLGHSRNLPGSPPPQRRSHAEQCGSDIRDERHQKQEHAIASTRAEPRDHVAAAGGFMTTLTQALPGATGVASTGSVASAWLVVAAAGALCLAVRTPAATAVLGLVAFGVLHNVLELRYVAGRYDAIL